MPRRPGTPVITASGAVRDSYINEHNLAGGHSVEQVRRAVRIEIESVERKADQLVVTVLVTNQGSGHMIPTGIPSRKLILSVEALTPRGSVHRESATFQKILVDREGNELHRDTDILLRGVRVAFDNRIAPKETRRLRFSFRIPPEEGVRIRAEISYIYEPMLLKQEIMEIPMGQALWPKPKK
jgi:hypothetical protein